jgi:hypothetical protein
MDSKIFNNKQGVNIPGWNNKITTEGKGPSVVPLFYFFEDIARTADS